MGRVPPLHTALVDPVGICGPAPRRIGDTGAGHGPPHRHRAGIGRPVAMTARAMPDRGPVGTLDTANAAVI
jgi:hypothetical protein